MPNEDDIFTQIAESPDAMKKIEALEAEAATADSPLEASKTAADTKPVADRAATADVVAKGAPDSKKQPDTLSEAEKQEVETAKTEAEKEGKELDTDDKGVPKRDAQGKFVKREKKVAEQPITLTADEQAKFAKWQEQQAKTKYGKDAIRKDNSWKALDAEKVAFKTERDNWQKALTEGRAKFDADVRAFQQEKIAATPTPEKHISRATELEGQAKVKNAEAITAENEGRVEDAEKLRKEAVVLDAKAREHRDRAEYLTKNPPPSVKQVQEKFKSDQKTWIDKAAIDFPEFGKRDSTLYKGTLEYYKELCKDPVVARLPGLIYFAAERTALKTAADKVPALEKELGELRTKVKDLDELTNPAGGGVVKRSASAKKFEDLNEDEQIAALKQEARGQRFD